LLSERLPTGVAKGVGLSPDELREMLGAYYRARQWDENGFVPDWKLTELAIPLTAKDAKSYAPDRPGSS